MSGAALPQTPPALPGNNGRRDDDDELFTQLVVSNPSSTRGGVGWHASIIGHTLGIALVVLVPLLWPERAPEHPDYIKALLYNPPPPPPPPLPKGTGMVEKAQPKPVTPDTKPQHEEKFTAQIPVETPKEVQPEAKAPETDQAGDPNGSDVGVPEGMAEGVPGGVVGGVPGGVLGGCVGCTGDSPVTDYDTAPRPIKTGPPQYPQDAFVKKIEGTVEVEILIDATGRVVNARILRSIPLLDQAALETVRRWVFAPAVKNGRPVATIAQAPVTFRIY